MSYIINIRENYPDEDRCICYLEKLRWPKSVNSPFDESSKVYQCASHKYKCRNTNKYFSVKTGTVFERTKIPLQKWFLAIYLYGISNGEINSYGLANELDIPQKTAYSLLHKVSKAVNAASNKTIKAQDLLLKKIIETKLGISRL